MLIIKGDIEAAKKAADERGITITDLRTDKWDHVLAEFLPEQKALIIAWYCETDSPPPGTGFPIGTLLYHS